MRNPASTTDWGTLRRHAGELVSDALNSTLPQIYDTFIEDGVEKRVLNAADTEAAKDKLAKIKQAFEAWIWIDTGAGRSPREDLQRAVQQPRAAALRRFASDDPRRVQRHQVLRAPEARHLAHSLGRLDLCRSRRRRRKDLHPRRRGHGAETARADHEADDDRARALSCAGGARVPAALPDRQYPRRRRDQFREGQASALPCPSRDRELGLHHHHPFGVQVHSRARRLRTGAHLGCDRLLRRPSRSGRRRGPRVAKAHRADEGRHGGEARGAESPQGRPLDDRRDRRRPGHRRRDAGVPQAHLHHQPEHAEGRRSGRVAARLGPLREGAIPRLEARAHASADRRLRHADHQHARRDVHHPAVLPARDARRARHSGIRRLGRRLRRDDHGPRIAAIGPIQAGQPLR